MSFTVNVSGVAEVQKALAGIGKAAPKATRLWCNWIGLEAQGEMRKQIGSRFSFRGTSEGFEKAIVFSQAKASGARKDKAELTVGGPGFGGSRTQKLGVILARHEEANTRTSTSQIFRTTGNQSTTGFFLPAKGLRTTSTNPPKALYPRNIGVSARRRVDGGEFFAGGSKKGSKKKGTGVSFFATDKGIFRRRHTSFGSADVEAIWWFRSRVKTPARLKLWATAEDVFKRRAVALGLQAIEETLFRETL
jgi:hypothetical protein